MSDFYTTIQLPGHAEFKDRGSKFLAFAYPLNDVSEFKIYLKELKKLHPKAAHHCFAYRIGIDKLNFRSSDDGEPSGTAGKPILGQIDSKGLTNTAVVVVRYFGGTLLGVSGLINAYKTTASLVLQVTPFIQKPIVVNYKFEFNYSAISDVKLMLNNFGAEIILQDLKLFCEITCAIPVKKRDEFEYKAKQIPSLVFT